jgi:hypothetical protein
MATTSQIEANRRNSQSSTGPRTESGKSTSSRNRLTFGLDTHGDYVKPDETEIYAEFCQTMYDQLTPANLIEETFVFEITAASWRLRRCAAAEAEICRANRHETSPRNDASGQDPLLDDATDKTRRSIERARAAAHLAISRSLNQLRKLQTERLIREKLDYGGVNDTLAAESRKLVAAQKSDMKTRQAAVDQQLDQAIDSIMSCPGAPSLADLQKMLDEDRAEKELASNCSGLQTVLGKVA